ncbi:MAG: aspartate kinase [Clostridiales bacterium]|nr:aspartate kinase [Clostridiales bacterium]
MGVKVVKFGGSSLAAAEGFRRVKEIIDADEKRRFCVPSAPGKRFSEDTKVTDLLYRCYSCLQRQLPMEEEFDRVGERYRQIASDLSLDFDVEGMLEDTRVKMLDQPTPDFCASRGEYMNGRLLAAYLGWDFVDPAEFIKFDRHGAFASEWTNETLSEELQKHERAVIPGFYGSFPNGEVHTFPRGGSDITGAVVARAVEAEVYENWTDVSGFLMADPRIVEKPKGIDVLTYRELRELSYMGATVLQEDAIFPVHHSGIPTNIRNTYDIHHPGTMIVSDGRKFPARYPITGIAGKKDFTLINIVKDMMNSELGFGRRVLQAAEELGIPFEHLPTGIDTMCVAIADHDLDKRLNQLLNRISELCQPDSIEVTRGLSLIATVGRGMVSSPGNAAKIFGALYQAGVNVRMIDQGSSELNIIVGVASADFEKATRAIYQAFVGD